MEVVEQLVGDGLEDVQVSVQDEDASGPGLHREVEPVLVVRDAGEAAGVAAFVRQVGDELALALGEPKGVRARLTHGVADGGEKDRGLGAAHGGAPVLRAVRLCRAFVGRPSSSAVMSKQSIRRSPWRERARA